MKILHLSTSDLEGGAGRATYRIHQGLQKVGVDSKMLVRAKLSIDPSVIAERSPLTKLGPPMGNLPLRLYHKRICHMFSPQWFPDAVATTVKQYSPNIVHLHWICNGFVQIETLAKLNKPLVWTLHDMWVFTGGCHTTQDCDRYQESCGKCPQLKSDRNWDLSRWIWQRKKRGWQNLNLTLVSPSVWLGERAKASSLFKNFSIEVIPHGLDLNKYRALEQPIARKLLNLPQDKQLILFGTSQGTINDYNKGFNFLKSALQHLSLSPSVWQDKLELVIFGSNEPEDSIDLDFKVHYLGQFHDDMSLALVYSAADVVVMPSRQEAFGQTASESLACGTPVVAFATTGLKDIVDHLQNGYLAKPFDFRDLATGIAWVLEDKTRCQKLRLEARKKAETAFSLELQAHRYLSVYQKITESLKFKI